MEGFLFPGHVRYPSVSCQWSLYLQTMSSWRPVYFRSSQRRALAAANGLYGVRALHLTARPGRPRHYSANGSDGRLETLLQTSGPRQIWLYWHWLDGSLLHESSLIRVFFPFYRGKAAFIGANALDESRNNNDVLVIRDISSSPERPERKPFVILPILLAPYFFPLQGRVYFVVTGRWLPFRPPTTDPVDVSAGGNFSSFFFFGTLCNRHWNNSGEIPLVSAAAL